VLRQGCGTESDKWLQQLKNNVIRTIFSRCMKAGEKFDHSLPPLYPDEQVWPCVRALFLIGTAQCIIRAFTFITVYMSCGRSAECAFVLRDGMQFDMRYKYKIFVHESIFSTTSHQVKISGMFTRETTKKKKGHLSNCFPSLL
jgi:hypothetical protein